MQGEPVPAQDVRDLEDEVDLPLHGEAVVVDGRGATEPRQVYGDHRASCGEPLHHLDPGHRRATEAVDEQLRLRVLRAESRRTSDADLQKGVGHGWPMGKMLGHLDAMPGAPRNMRCQPLPTGGRG